MSLPEQMKLSKLISYQDGSVVSREIIKRDSGSVTVFAVDAVLLGYKISENQRPSSGCNIKWREGNEPEYFNI